MDKYYGYILKVKLEFTSGLDAKNQREESSMTSRFCRAIEVKHCF